MRRFWLLFLYLPFFSCQYFLSKEERVNRMVDKKMTEIDLNNVDQYPLFKNCDETVSKEEQQQCFITELMLHFESIIEELNFESKMNLEDTLWVDLKVDEQGYVTINNFLQNDNLESAIPELSEELMNRLNDSTKIEPALKRGVPVSIRVRLPILVETKG